jgi:hypothetical protein
MKVTDLIADFTNQLQIAIEDVTKMEEEFQDTKINPYGVTKIDFEKRNVIKEQVLRLEGAVEALTLAAQHCEELGGTWEENAES